MCWLQQSSLYGDCDAHKTLYECDFDSRKAAREDLKAVPGAESLFKRERAKRADEGSEPEDFE